MAIDARDLDEYLDLIGEGKVRGFGGGARPHISYNANARDADNDRIVQEGTPFARPAGPRSPKVHHDDVQEARRRTDAAAAEASLADQGMDLYRPGSSDYVLAKQTREAARRKLAAAAADEQRILKEWHRHLLTLGIKADPIEVKKATYNANASDADNDRIVQEGTPFARPAAPKVNKVAAPDSSPDDKKRIAAVHKFASHITDAARKGGAKATAKLESASPANIRDYAEGLAANQEIDLAEVAGVITRFQEHWQHSMVGEHATGPGITLALAILEVLAEVVELARKAREHHKEMQGKARATYDPNARDADNDRIVQEGTPYARPASPHRPGRSTDVVDYVATDNLMAGDRITLTPGEGPVDVVKIDYETGNYFEPNAEITVRGPKGTRKVTVPMGSTVAMHRRPDLSQGSDQPADPTPTPNVGRVAALMKIGATKGSAANIIRDRKRGWARGRTPGETSFEGGGRREPGRSAPPSVKVVWTKPEDLKLGDTIWTGNKVGKVTPSAVYRTGDTHTIDDYGDGERDVPVFSTGAYFPKMKDRAVVKGPAVIGHSFPPGEDPDLYPGFNVQYESEEGGGNLIPRSNELVPVVLTLNGRDVVRGGRGTKDYEGGRIPYLELKKHGHGKHRGRQVAYNPDAIDADRDMIVQEGTPYARPYTGHHGKPKVPKRIDQIPGLVRNPDGSYQNPLSIAPTGPVRPMAPGRDTFGYLSQGADSPVDPLAGLDRRQRRTSSGHKPRRSRTEMDALKARPLRDEDYNPGVNFDELSDLMGFKGDAERENFLYWLTEDGGDDAYWHMNDMARPKGKQPVVGDILAPLGRAYKRARDGADERGIVYPFADRYGGEGWGAVASAGADVPLDPAAVWDETNILNAMHLHVTHDPVYQDLAARGFNSSQIPIIKASIANLDDNQRTAYLKSWHQSLDGQPNRMKRSSHEFMAQADRDALTAAGAPPPPIRVRPGRPLEFATQGTDAPFESEDDFRARLSPEMQARYDAADERGRQVMRSALPADPFEGLQSQGADEPVDPAAFEADLEDMLGNGVTVSPYTDPRAVLVQTPETHAAEYAAEQRLYNSGLDYRQTDRNEFIVALPHPGPRRLGFPAPPRAGRHHERPGHETVSMQGAMRARKDKRHAARRAMAAINADSAFASQGLDKPGDSVAEINAWLDDIGKQYGSVPANPNTPRAGRPSTPPTVLTVPKKGTTAKPKVGAGPDVTVMRNYPKPDWIVSYRTGDLFHRQRIPGAARNDDYATALQHARNAPGLLPPGANIIDETGAVQSQNPRPNPHDVPLGVMNLSVPVPKDMTEVKAAVADLQAEFAKAQSGREYFPAHHGKPTAVAIEREEKIRAIGAGIDNLAKADPKYIALKAADDAAYDDYASLGRADPDWKTKRKAWWDANASASRYYAEATRKLLAQVRPMGPQGDPTKYDNITFQGVGVDGAQQEADLRSAVEKAIEYYPTEWLDTFHDWTITMDTDNSPSIAGAGGYFLPTGRKKGQIHLEEAKPATAAHEMGHVMERSRRALPQAEWVFLNRRSGGQDPVDGWGGYQGMQYPDEFMDAYIGHSYEDRGARGYRADAWEAFTRGMEWVSGWGKMMRSQPTPDPDYRAFMVGVLATM